jgi:hypothetical protein
MRDGGDEPRRSEDNAKERRGLSPPNGASPSDFVTTILDNLRKAGVHNTKRGEKLVFAITSGTKC